MRIAEGAMDLEGAAAGSDRPSSIFSMISSKASLLLMTKCSSASGRVRCRCFDFSVLMSTREERGYCCTGVCASIHVRSWAPRAGLGTDLVGL